MTVNTHMDHIVGHLWAKMVLLLTQDNIKVKILNYLLFLLVDWADLENLITTMIYSKHVS